MKLDGADKPGPRLTYMWRKAEDPGNSIGDVGMAGKEITNTEIVRSLRYDLNHSRAVPVTPTQFSRLSEMQPISLTAPRQYNSQHQNSS